ncbi:MAG: hypothetical protein QXI27_07220 [Nitrososphaerota archaeon]|nr:hypothetical protein [Candidatus Brockarchaeota archaeon]
MSELFETLRQTLKDESGYEFELRGAVDESTGTSYKQLVRKFDIQSLPMILRLSLEGGLYDYYRIWSAEPKRDIDWERDWKDDNPIFIDYVEASSDRLTIGTFGEFQANFMAKVYYDVDEIIFEPRDEIYTNREDRMKLARYVPAVVKDIEVALKLVTKVSADSEISASEFKLLRSKPSARELDFTIVSEFQIAGMNTEDIIKNVIERIKVISKWRKEFRTWLSSLQRKEFYEGSKRVCEVYKREREKWWVTGSPGLIKWPVDNKKVREILMEYHIYRYLDHGAPLFTFDGYGIVGYRMGHEYKFKFWVDRRQKKFQRLKPLPLEKIEFLKEDFPEMFKE